MKKHFLNSLMVMVLLLASHQTFSQNKTAMSKLYDISINDINGDAINLNDFKGKYILFVNVASECGFTPQYKELQELHKAHQDKLVIIGVPCNQFGGQEPGSPTEIKAFCSKNYGVEFLITEKVDVKGDNIHPLYQWLTLKENNGVKSSSVKWNFQKYFIGKDGAWVDYFFSTTSPTSEKIVSLIK